MWYSSIVVLTVQDSIVVQWESDILGVKILIIWHSLNCFSIKFDFHVQVVILTVICIISYHYYYEISIPHYNNLFLRGFMWYNHRNNFMSLYNKTKNNLFYLLLFCSLFIVSLSLSFSHGPLWDQKCKQFLFVIFSQRMFVKWYIILQELYLPDNIIGKIPMFHQQLYVNPSGQWK